MSFTSLLSSSQLFLAQRLETFHSQYVSLLVHHSLFSADEIAKIQQKKRDFEVQARMNPLLASKKSNDNDDRNGNGNSSGSGEKLQEEESRVERLFWRHIEWEVQLEKLRKIRLLNHFNEIHEQQETRKNKNKRRRNDQNSDKERRELERQFGKLFSSRMIDIFNLFLHQMKKFHHRSIHSAELDFPDSTTEQNDSENGPVARSVLERMKDSVWGNLSSSSASSDSAPTKSRYIDIWFQFFEFVKRFKKSYLATLFIKILKQNPMETELWLIASRIERNSILLQSDDQNKTSVQREQNPNQQQLFDSLYEIDDLVRNRTRRNHDADADALQLDTKGQIHANFQNARILLHQALKFQPRNPLLLQELFLLELEFLVHLNKKRQLQLVPQQQQKQHFDFGLVSIVWTALLKEFPHDYVFLFEFPALVFEYFSAVLPRLLHASTIQLQNESQNSDGNADDATVIELMRPVEQFVNSMLDAIAASVLDQLQRIITTATMTKGVTNSRNQTTNELHRKLGYSLARVWLFRFDLHFCVSSSPLSSISLVAAELRRQSLVQFFDHYFLLERQTNSGRNGQDDDGDDDNDGYESAEGEDESQDEAKREQQSAEGIQNLFGEEMNEFWHGFWTYVIDRLSHTEYRSILKPHGQQEQEEEEKEVEEEESLADVLSKVQWPGLKQILQEQR